jgi:hypothetical protein
MAAIIAKINPMAEPPVQKADFENWLEMRDALLSYARMLSKTRSLSTLLIGTASSMR